MEHTKSQAAFEEARQYIPGGYHADFNAGCGTAVDLITGQPHDFGGGSDLPPYSCAFWRMEH